jgi:hypothetical protein
MLNLFVGLSSLLDLGLTKALIVGLRQRDFPPGELVASALMLTTTGALLVAALLMYGLSHDWPIYGPAVMAQGDLRWWLSVCGVMVIFAQLTTTILRGVLEADYKSDIVNIGFAAFTVVFYAVAAGLALVSRNPRVLIGGSTVVYAAFLVIHWFLARRGASAALCLPSTRAARSLLHYGIGAFLFILPTIIVAPLFQFGLQRYTVDARQYAVFDLALRISGLAATALCSISTPFFALVAGSPAERSVEMRAAVWRHLRLSFMLMALGLLACWFIGSSALALIFPTADTVLFRTTGILLSGAAFLSAVEPATLMMLGLGRLRALVAVRMLMLGTAIIAVQALAGLKVLDRFAASLAVGNAIAALATLGLNRLERWGRASEVPPAAGGP